MTLREIEQLLIELKVIYWTGEIAQRIDKAVLTLQAHQKRQARRKVEFKLRTAEKREALR